VNLTWWSGPYFRRSQHPTEEGFIAESFMTGFADFLLAGPEEVRLRHARDDSRTSRKP